MAALTGPLAVVSLAALFCLLLDGALSLQAEQTSTVEQSHAAAVRRPITASAERFPRIGPLGVIFGPRGQPLAR